MQVDLGLPHCLRLCNEHAAKKRQMYHVLFSPQRRARLLVAAHLKHFMPHQKLTHWFDKIKWLGQMV